jgi:hypothetical protein
MDQNWLKLYVPLYCVENWQYQFYVFLCFQVSLLNIVVELKKCCNHPFLFESADHGYGGDISTNDSSKLERIILSSGKLVILDKLLVRLHKTKHRVLIFSQVFFKSIFVVMPLGQTFSDCMLFRYATNYKWYYDLFHFGSASQLNVDKLINYLEGKHWSLQHFLILLVYNFKI